MDRTGGQNTIRVRVRVRVRVRLRVRVRVRGWIEQVGRIRG